MKKIIVMLLSMVLCIVLFNYPVSAYCHWTGGYKYTQGASNLSWTFYNGTNQTNNYNLNYQNICNTSCVDWTSLCSDCNLSYSTLNLSLPMNTYDVYFLVGNFGNDGSAGGCWFFNSLDYRVNASSYTAPTSSYSYVIIRLNNYYLQDISLGELCRCICGHELGHALGLAHTGDPATIMYEYAGTQFHIYSISTPQSDDINGVNALY